MALEFRLYRMQLDEELEGHLSKSERRYALREVKNLAEDIAFVSARRDERMAPEDEDWHRALAALRPPSEAAKVLARKRPIYRRRAIVNSVRGWGIVIVLALVVVLVSQFATSEQSIPLASASYGTAQPVDATVIDQNFTVSRSFVRLDVTAQAEGLDAGGSVVVTILDPHDQFQWTTTLTRNAKGYDEANLVPQLGTWRILVDYHTTAGSSSVTVNGIVTRSTNAPSF
ncbi:MAG: hypothetical protein ACYDDF_12450 [Thermoplasmatota archaeon]